MFWQNIRFTPCNVFVMWGAPGANFVAFSYFLFSFSYGLFLEAIRRTEGTSCSFSKEKAISNARPLPFELLGKASLAVRRTSCVIQLLKTFSCISGLLGFWLNFFPKSLGEKCSIQIAHHPLIFCEVSLGFTKTFLYKERDWFWATGAHLEIGENAFI